MDARQVQEAVELIDVTCRRIAELRQRRIGNRTPLRLLDDWHVASASIRAASSPYEQGILLAQKALLFNHDHLLNGIGNLGTMLGTLGQFAAEPLVQHEISRSGHDWLKTQDCLEQASLLVRQYRAAAEEHERLLAQGLDGKSIALDELEAIERQLLGFSDWEHKIIGVCRAAADRIRQHPAFGSEEMSESASRMAAALVLSLAGTVARQSS
jgi:hypothetical protein